MKYSDRTGIKGLLAAVLAAVLLLSCGCTGTETPEATEADDVTSAEEKGGVPGEQTQPSAGPDSSVLFLGQAPLKDFVIVYRSDAMYSVRGAVSLARAILDRYGLQLTLRPDTDAPAAHEIRVGDTSRGAGARLPADGMRWMLAADGPNLSLSASAPYLLTAAADKAAACIRSETTDFAAAAADLRLEGELTFRDLMRGDSDDAVERTPESDLRIMSFNILHENYNDRLPLNGRADGVAAVLAAYRPDVVGLEEVSDAWHGVLDGIFCGTYAFVPDILPDGSRSYSTLMYDTTRAELLEYGVTVYSASTNARLRNLLWGRFRRLSDRQEYMVTVTHWDINDHAADRVKQAEQNAELLCAMQKKYGLPIFSCGDYNRNETTAEFTGFLSETGMKDAKLTAMSSNAAGTTGKSSHEVGKFPGGGPKDACIDHIVCSPEAEILYYTTVTDGPALDASDHCAIYADIRIGATRASEAAALPPAAPTGWLFGTLGDARLPLGRGSASDPWTVGTAEELRGVCAAVRSGTETAGKYLTQSADIDLGNQEWLPIGFSGFPFRGKYDGGGHTVSGLSITRRGDSLGLFGQIASRNPSLASLSSLTVEGKIAIADLANDEVIGGVCGICGILSGAAGKTTVSNVTSRVEITLQGGGEPRVGGICGQAYCATLSGCVNEAAIDGQLDTPLRLGGIAGQIFASELAVCRNAGALSSVSAANAYAGGICGIVSYSDMGSAKIRLCENAASVTARSAVSAYAAGILSYAYSSETAVGVSVTDSFNTAPVRAEVTEGTRLGYAGGIIGYCSKKQCAVQSCVNVSSEIAGHSPAGDRAGGIVGVFNLASDNATLSVTGCATVGKLAGYFKAAEQDNKTGLSVSEAESAAAALRRKMTDERSAAK